MKKSLDKLVSAVNHPSHYQGITIKGKECNGCYESIELINSIVEHLKCSPSVSYAVGNSLKYIFRAGKKESDNSTTSSIMTKCAQDLMKAAWYLNSAAETILSEIEE